MPPDQIEKAGTLARKAMIGYESENIHNYDETRFNPWANTNSSFQPTHFQPTLKIVIFESFYSSFALTAF